VEIDGPERGRGGLPERVREGGLDLDGRCRVTGARPSQVWDARAVAEGAQASVRLLEDRIRAVERRR
jgi:hypothetical protein